MNSPEDLSDAGKRLGGLLAEAGLAALGLETTRQFECYLSLILRWNSRTNLTAVRDPDAIVARHFVESIACAQTLPAGIKSLLDFGSGAGFPGLPIALCRPEIAVTLAESQGKKAAFLREAVRSLDLPVTVHAARAEALLTVFDCVVLRAVDKMPEAVTIALRLVARDGCLALMTTRGDSAGLHEAAGPSFSWEAPIALPGGSQRILSLGRKLNSPA